MEGKIMLWGSLLDQNYEGLQDAFTRIKDRLQIMRTEAEMLSFVWQGNAKEEWKSTFLKSVDGLAEEAEGTYRYLMRLKEQASLLVKKEQEIRELVE